MIPQHISRTTARRSTRLMKLGSNKKSKDPVEVVDMTLEDSDNIERADLNGSMSILGTSGKSVVKKNNASSSKGMAKVVHQESDDDFGAPVTDKQNMKKTSKATAGNKGKLKRVVNRNKANRELHTKPENKMMHQPNRIRARSPPLSLYSFIKAMTEGQKNSVKELGFESMLQFNVAGIPSQLGLIAVENFDAEVCTLTVHKRLVSVTKETVHAVLGIPLGDIPICALLACKKNDPITTEWRKQFPSNITRIYLGNVLDRMRDQPEGGRLFKLNFLVFFVTIMVEAVTNGTVNQRFLPCLTNLDESMNLDWCGYVVEALKRSKQGWHKKVHYNGPLTMLVVLYANTLQPKKGPKSLNEAMVNVWTNDMLFKVEEHEVNSARRVTTGVTAEVVKNNEDADDIPLSPIKAKRLRRTSLKRKLNEPSTCPNPSVVEPVFSSGQGAEPPGCSQTPTTIMGYKRVCTENMVLIHDVCQRLDDVLVTATMNFPEEEEFKKMKGKLQRLMGVLAGESSSSKVEKKTNDVNQATDAYNDVDDVSETQFYNPSIMRIIEDKEREFFEKSRSNGVAAKDVSISVGGNIEMSSFSLGLTQLEPTYDLGVSRQPKNEVQDVIKNVANVNQIEAVASGLGADEGHNVDMCESLKNNDAVGAKNQEPGINIDCEEDAHNRGRMKRVTKLSDVLLSPFVMREVCLYERLTLSERNTKDCVFAARLPSKDIIFRTDHAFYPRVIFESMIPGLTIVSDVVDVWCTLLNHEERRRDKTKVSRLFFDDSRVTQEMLNNNIDALKLTEMFTTSMNMLVQSSEYRSLAEVDLVFFPVQQSGHHFVICYHMRFGQMHFLDNVNSDEKNIRKRYGILPMMLTNLMFDYVLKNSPAEINKMDNPAAKVLKMKWQTKINLVDSAVFAMRHMELYRWDGNGFDVGLMVEGVGQKKQLDDLRYKYLSKMLLSDCNLVKDYVSKEVDEYMKLPGFERQRRKVDAVNRIEERLGE